MARRCLGAKACLNLTGSVMPRLRVGSIWNWVVKEAIGWRWGLGTWQGRTGGSATAPLNGRWIWALEWYKPIIYHGIPAHR